VRRLGGRWICRGCGRSFHETSNPYGGEPCSSTGAECDLYQRDDDRPEAVANRLDVYDSQTSPLIEYYESRGLLRRVDGALSLDDVQAQVVEAIS
jgi:adenylate kinase